MSMRIPRHKTKIVCTIGPASRSKKVLKEMILSGMNVARLNLSHGDLETHAHDIQTIRELAAQLKTHVTILVDLPGPKIRIGKIKGGFCVLKKGDKVTLTSREVEGTATIIPVRFKGFAEGVSKRSKIFLNDGFIQLRVINIGAEDVICRVITGGQLLSNKGLNLPGAGLSVNPVTARDLDLVDFGLSQGVDIFCASFVRGAEDIVTIKEYVRGKGRDVFVVAKIERIEALENIDSIIKVSDAVMIARGDLGVEIPIERVPVTQKHLILKAGRAAKPVITATQMLESMTDNIRPTRAEVTDVANAILDGTDAVMLSEETAIGKYPVEAVKMLVRVARSTEGQRDEIVSSAGVREAIKHSIERRGATIEDALSLDVVNSINTLNIRYVVAPTMRGGTPRSISRFKTGSWVLAFCANISVMNLLDLSYGVFPILIDRTDSDYAIMLYMKEQGLLRSKDTIIMLRRLPRDELGSTNSFKIVSID